MATNNVSTRTATSKSLDLDASQVVVDAREVSPLFRANLMLIMQAALSGNIPLLLDQFELSQRLVPYSDELLAKKDAFLASMGVAV